MTRSNKPLNSNDPYNRHGTRHTRSNDSNGGKIVGIAVGAVAIAAIAAAGLYLVDVDQTQEARLPNVDVQVSEGQMPRFDAEVADVNLATKEVEVDVPKMDVETETKTIEVEVPVDINADVETETVTVPTVDIERPTIDSPDNDEEGDSSG